MIPPSDAQAQAFFWDAKVNQRLDFTGPWQGWKMRAQFLYSPHGDRLSPSRLAGLCWREASEQRLAKARARKAAAEAAKHQFVKVVVVTLAEYRDRQTLRGAA